MSSLERGNMKASGYQIIYSSRPCARKCPVYFHSVFGQFLLSSSFIALCARITRDFVTWLFLVHNEIVSPAFGGWKSMFVPMQVNFVMLTVMVSFNDVFAMFRVF